ncbi:hypothetical protein BDZ97DRAFT_1917904 [Flammula alnicola]|nr:hypothetical protein BDZ97DRAFT_1917904 [Flammula alnicola]
MSRPRPTIKFDPSQYDRLPFEFQPPQDGSAGFRAGKLAVLKLMPVEHLPKGLIPKRGLFVQPPRFHYGWPYTNAELFEMGSRCGFLDLTPVPPGKVPGVKYMSNLGTQDKLVKMVREQLGIRSCTPELCGALSKKSFICISLTTNYKRGNRTPPTDDVRVIQEFLGIVEPPSWLLDAEGCHNWDVRWIY